MKTLIRVAIAAVLIYGTASAANKHPKPTPQWSNPVCPDGTKGIPVIGSDGEVVGFICDVSGIQGPQGPQGPPGPPSKIPGPPGPAGPVGPASTVSGPAGATGPAGPADNYLTHFPLSFSEIFLGGNIGEFTSTKIWDGSTLLWFPPTSSHTLAGKFFNVQPGVFKLRVAVQEAFGVAPGCIVFVLNGPAGGNAVSSCFGPNGWTAGLGLVTPNGNFMQTSQLTLPEHHVLWFLAVVDSPNSSISYSSSGVDGTWVPLFTSSATQVTSVEVATWGKGNYGFFLKSISE